MALDYSDRYPGQVDDSDPNFPLGKARNIVVEGDGTGTPWEEDLVNDIWGFLQALLVGASITASGAVDNANTSQYLEAVQNIVGNNNVKRRGAKGDNVASDSTAINNAIIAIAAQGGGELYLPPGRYRITATLMMLPGVSLRGEPGLTTIALDHATAGLLDFGAVTYDSPIFFRHIAFEGNQVNTGQILQAAAVNVQAQFFDCSINKTGTNLTGLILNNLIADCTFDGCYLRSLNTTATVAIRGTRLRFNGGRCVLAPAAVAEMISSAQSCVVDGTRFAQVSTVGDVAFIDCSTGSVQCENAFFDVDDSMAGNITFAFRLNGNVLHTSNNRFFNNARRYKLVAPCLQGSTLQLDPAERIQISGTSTTFPDGVAVIVLESNNVAPPGLLLGRILYIGQPQDVVVHNGGGGTWAGSVVISAQTPDDQAYVESAAGFAGLLSNRALSVRYVATNFLGTPYWVQIGPVVQLS